MTISEQLQTLTAELISRNGIGCEISSQELKALIDARFDTNFSSVIPSDYCYNRVNKGIAFLKYPRLFAYIGRGMYKCLGENYPYDGPVYAQPKGSKTEMIVGTWKNRSFTPNLNWESCCLK